MIDELRRAEHLLPYGADCICGPVVGGALIGQAVAAEMRVSW